MQSIPASTPYTMTKNYMVPPLATGSYNIYISLYGFNITQNVPTDNYIDFTIVCAPISGAPGYEVTVSVIYSL